MDTPKSQPQYNSQGHESSIEAPVLSPKSNGNSQKSSGPEKKLSESLAPGTHPLADDSNPMEADRSPTVVSTEVRKEVSARSPQKARTSGDRRNDQSNEASSKPGNQKSSKQKSGQQNSGNSISGGGQAGKDVVNPEADEPAKKTGRWTPDEKEQFVNALRLFGKDWKRVEQHIKTRSGAQVRSHAQKFFLNVEKTKGMDIDEYIAELQKENPPDLAEKVAAQAQMPPSKPSSTAPKSKGTEPKKVEGPSQREKSTKDQGAMFSKQSGKESGMQTPTGDFMYGQMDNQFIGNIYNSIGPSPPTINQKMRKTMPQQQQYEIMALHQMQMQQQLNMYNPLMAKMGQFPQFNMNMMGRPPFMDNRMPFNYPGFPPQQQSQKMPKLPGAASSIHNSYAKQKEKDPEPVERRIQIKSVVKEASEIAKGDWYSIIQLGFSQFKVDFRKIWEIRDATQVQQISDDEDEENIELKKNRKNRRMNNRLFGQVYARQFAQIKSPMGLDDGRLEPENIDIPNALECLLREVNKLDYGEFNQVEIDFFEDYSPQFDKSAEAVNIPREEPEQQQDGESDGFDPQSAQAIFLTLFERQTNSQKAKLQFTTKADEHYFSIKHGQIVVMGGRGPCDHLFSIVKVSEKICETLGRKILITFRKVKASGDAMKIDHGLKLQEFSNNFKHSPTQASKIGKTPSFGGAQLNPILKLPQYLGHSEHGDYDHDESHTMRNRRYRDEQNMNRLMSFGINDFPTSAYNMNMHQHFNQKQDELKEEPKETRSSFLNLENDGFPHHGRGRAYSSQSGLFPNPVSKSQDRKTKPLLQGGQPAAQRNYNLAISDNKSAMNREDKSQQDEKKSQQIYSPPKSIGDFGEISTNMRDPKRGAPQKGISAINQHMKSLIDHVTSSRVHSKIDTPMLGSKRRTEESEHSNVPGASNAKQLSTMIAQPDGARSGWLGGTATPQGKEYKEPKSFANDVKIIKHNKVAPPLFPPRGISEMSRQSRVSNVSQRTNNPNKLNWMNNMATSFIRQPEPMLQNKHSMMSHNSFFSGLLNQPKKATDYSGIDPTKQFPQRPSGGSNVSNKLSSMGDQRRNEFGSEVAERVPDSIGASISGHQHIEAIQSKKNSHYINFLSELDQASSRTSLLQPEATKVIDQYKSLFTHTQDELLKLYRFEETRIFKEQRDTASKKKAPGSQTYLKDSIDSRIISNMVEVYNVQTLLTIIIKLLDIVNSQQTSDREPKLKMSDVTAIDLNAFKHLIPQGYYKGLIKKPSTPVGSGEKDHMSSNRRRDLSEKQEGEDNHEFKRPRYSETDKQLQASEQHKPDLKKSPQMGYLSKSEDQSQQDQKDENPTTLHTNDAIMVTQIANSLSPHPEHFIQQDKRMIGQKRDFEQAGLEDSEVEPPLPKRIQSGQIKQIENASPPQFEGINPEGSSPNIMGEEGSPSGHTMSMDNFDGGEIPQSHPEEDQWDEKPVG